jgi:hypothetical protein
LPLPQIKPWFLLCPVQRPVIPPITLSRLPSTPNLANHDESVTNMKTQNLTPQSYTVYGFMCWKLQLWFLRRYIIHPQTIWHNSVRHKAQTNITLPCCHKYCFD